MHNIHELAFADLFFLSVAILTHSFQCTVSPHHGRISRCLCMQAYRFTLSHFGFHYYVPSDQRITCEVPHQ